MIYYNYALNYVSRQYIQKQELSVVFHDPSTGFYILKKTNVYK